VKGEEKLTDKLSAVYLAEWEIKLMVMVQMYLKP
jgi:hypothetical protein